MVQTLDQPLVVRSLVDELVERLETAIMTGELKAGTLIREQTLARGLGVSRGPLREAVRRLEGRKLLQRTPNVGARVLDLNLMDLREVWAVREAIEGMAASLAASNMTAEEIAALGDTIKRDATVATMAKTERFAGLDTDYDFHNLIVQGSRNTRLINMVNDDIRYILQVYRYKWTVGRPERAKAALAEHKAIYAAIKARNSVEAERTMRLHIQNSLKSIMGDFADKT